MAVRPMHIFEICDDGSFWGVIHGTSLLKINTEIEHFYDRLNYASDSIEIGDLCLVESRFGNSDVLKWYRAKVCSILSSRVYLSRIELFLIDRGSVIVSSFESIRAIPSQLVDYPPLAQNYHFKDLVPHTQDSNLRWKNIVKSHLNAMCGKEDPVVNAIIDSNGSAILYVKDIDSQNEINFNKFLVNAELCQKLDYKGPENEAVLNTVKRSKMKVPSSSSFPCVGENDNKTAMGELDKKITSNFTGMKVFVNTSIHFGPVSINSSCISTSVIRELRNIGMTKFTTVQSVAIPYIQNKKNTVLISPSLTGKTLSYLLPLSCMISSSSHQNELKMIILVATSWQARSVEVQVQKIMTWLNPGDQNRCSCATYASEIECMHHLINGSSILVSTPSSALRLRHINPSMMNQVSYMVFDDYNLLLQVFRNEVKELVQIMSSDFKPQIVVAASYWSNEISSFIDSLYDPVLIMTCYIEVAIKSHMNLIILPSFESKIMNIITEEKTTICTSTQEEAQQIYEDLRVGNWSPVLITEDNFNDSDFFSKLTVVSDETLRSTLQIGTRCCHIIHFSPPLSKASFRMRLSLLDWAITNNISCKSTVLIDENWTKQAAFLCEMMKRLALPVNSLIKTMVAKQIKMNEDLFDYCYQLKAWGYCRKRNCGSLHNFVNRSLKNLNRPPSLLLPKDGIVKIKVNHISNANRLWVILLEHIPLFRGDVSTSFHDPMVFKKLSLDLAQYYAVQENQKYHGSPCEGCYCGYQCDSGNYFRVQVLKFSQPLGFYFPHKEKAMVRLIDVGSIEIVDVNQLLCLPPELLKVPPQVVEAYISGIKPKDMDSDWPKEALQYCRRMLQDKVVYGKVGLSFEHTLWLEFLEYKTLLPDIQVATALYSPSQELIKANLAENNVDHLKGVKEHMIIEEFHKQTAMFVNLKQSEKRDVCVTAIESPASLYVQSVDCITRLNEIEDSLNSAVSLVSSGVSFEIKDVCCALFPIDSRWYRGQIRMVGIDNYEVFFVDYGDTEWVHSSKVLPLHNSVLDLPFQAIECSITSGDQDWSSDVDNVLWKITRDNVYVLEVEGICSSHNKEEINKYSVILTNKETGSNLLKDLGKNNSCGRLNTFDRDNFEALSLLKDSNSDSMRKEYSEELQYLIMTHPYSCYSEYDLSSICQMLPSLSSSSQILIPLLRFLCGLQLFHKCDFELSISDLLSLMKCLMSSSHIVVELTLLILRTFIMNIRESLCEDQCLVLLQSCLEKWKAFSVITESIIEILFLVNVSEKYRLSDEAYCHFSSFSCDPNLKTSSLKDYCLNLTVNKNMLSYNSKLTPIMEHKTQLHPKVLWSQNDSHILLAVQIPGCAKDAINILVKDISTVDFMTTVDLKEYKFSLVLFSAISPKNYVIKAFASEVLIELAKIDCKEWPRLTRASKKCIFLAYDISRWQYPENDNSKEPLQSTKYEQFCGEDYCGNSNDEEDDDDEHDLNIGDCNFLFDD